MDPKRIGSHNMDPKKIGSHNMDPKKIENHNMDPKTLGIKIAQKPHTVWSLGAQKP